jgi:hypothetical protein
MSLKVLIQSNHPSPTPISITQEREIPLAGQQCFKPAAQHPSSPTVAPSASLLVEKAPSQGVLEEGIYLFMN